MSMNDQARKKLCDVIANYGSTICNTPRTCVMVLGQACAEFPAEKDLLLRALDRGAVTGVIKAPVGGPWEEEIKRVAGSSVAPADAKWAVESWAIALGKHPDAAPLPPEPVISKHAPPDATKTGVVRATGSTMLVGIGGAMGGAFTSMVLMLVAVILTVKAPPFDFGLPVGMAIIFILVAGVIGGLISGTSGALGWTVIQMQSSALSVSTEQMNQRLRKGFGGALMGAMVGGAVGAGIAIFCIWFGLIGVVAIFFIPIGLFLGGLGGGVSGAMAGAAGGTSRTY
jgi:hypothetical protein